MFRAWGKGTVCGMEAGKYKDRTMLFGVFGLICHFLVYYVKRLCDNCEKRYTNKIELNWIDRRK